MFGVFFGIGVIPLVGIAFFSPGLGLGGHVGLWGFALFAFQPLVLPVLIVSAVRRKSFSIWILLGMQVSLVIYILSPLVFKWVMLIDRFVGFLHFGILLQAKG